MAERTEKTENPLQVFYKKVLNKIRFILQTKPFFNRFYFKFFYRGVEGKESLAEMQKIAHVIDLRITDGGNIPKGDLYKLQYLLNIAFENNEILDDALLWCIKMYLRGRYKLKEPEQILQKDRSSLSQNNKKYELLTEVICERRSVRKWTNDKVDIDVIKNIIEIAKWAPASCNRQLCRLLIVTQSQDKEFLGDFFPNVFYKKAPVLVVCFIDIKAYGDNERHFIYLDGSALIQNLLLLLHANGLGACWVGFKGWDCYGNIFIDKIKYKDFYHYFKLDESLVPISMVALGVPAYMAKAPLRQGLHNILLNSEYVS